jgi:protocatechuate 3,4-dioxygenase beta subunit
MSYALPELSASLALAAILVAAPAHAAGPSAPPAGANDALMLVPGATVVAQNQPATPAQPRGPFYPITLPNESDPDLARYGDQSAEGQPLVVAGRILDRAGAPVGGAKVEIWQTNARGRYHHEKDDSPAPVDPGFQGWGQETTDATGSFRFRTVMPRAYSGRTPHIHFAVTAPGGRPFYTQLYFPDAPENREDLLLQHLSREQQQRLMARIERPAAGGEPVARFDIVLP